MENFVHVLDGLIISVTSNSTQQIMNSQSSRYEGDIFAFTKPCNKSTTNNSF